MMSLHGVIEACMKIRKFFQKESHGGFMQSLFFFLSQKVIASDVACTIWIGVVCLRIRDENSQYFNTAVKLEFFDLFFSSSAQMLIFAIIQ